MLTGKEGDGIISSVLNSTLLLTSCVLKDNQGVAVLTSNGNITINHSKIEGNSDTMTGGLRSSGSVVTISNSDFTRNTANTGGAAWFEAASKATINNSTFSHNQAKSEGGAITSYGQFLEMYNCTISENTAGQFGGGIYVSLENTKFKAVGILYYGNKAKLDGGAIHINSINTDTAIERCTFWNNFVEMAQGSAIGVGSKTLRIANSIFSAPANGSFLNYRDTSPSHPILYTYTSEVIFKNITYSTTDQKFLEEMEKTGLIHVPVDINVTQRETEFASGNYSTSVRS